MSLLKVFLFLGVPAMFMADPDPQLTGEIKSYQQIGDKIRGEYSLLHPDGSVTKTLAFGDTKQGLQYKTFQMDSLGNVKQLDVPNQASQLNQGMQPAQLDQGQQQSQIAGQPGSAQSSPGAQGAVPPGVNWFFQQPQVSPVASALDPFAPDPIVQAVAPLIQEPLPYLTNPLWNLWNF